MNTSQAKILIVEIGEYVFSVGSTGDSPVSSGDPPDGIGRGIERKGAVLSQPHVTAIPPGGSPGGAGGSPAPPTLNRYSARRQQHHVAFCSRDLVVLNSGKEPNNL